ncbi:MAG: DUF362 domain-containing protein [Phycisphaerae bacterium]
MNRREFVRQVAAWSAASAAVPFFDVEFAHSAPRGPSTLAVGKDTDYADLVNRVVAKVGGMGAFVKRGDKVVVKPNIGWDRTPAQAANTNPEVVKAVVKLVLDQGAKEVLVFDRPCDNPQRCYHNSGIQQAVASIGDHRARCEFMQNWKFVPVQIKHAKVLHEWPLYRPALEADCYINVPIAKNHNITRLTLGLKNTMGVCGGNRGHIHQQIPEKLTDLALVIAPKVTIIDATRIMLRNGPSGGSLKYVKVLNTLLASTDPVAADAYATTLFGLKPTDIAPTVAAYRRGLGEIDLAKIRIIEA